MSATISGSWNSSLGDEPNGTATVGSGSNRKLVMFLGYEQNSQRTVSAFTIGGQTFDEVVKYYETSTTADSSIEVYVWNEASIAAMTGSSIVYTDDSSNANIGWGYVTVQDCVQTDFSAYTGTHYKASGSSDQDVTTTSTADDYVVVAVRSTASGALITTWDTLAEIFDGDTDTGGAMALGAGAGGDNTTTVAGNNNNVRTYASLVFDAAASGINAGVLRRRRQ